MRAGIASTLGISVDNSLTPASAGTGKGGTADVPRSCPNLKPASQPASLPPCLPVCLSSCLSASLSVSSDVCLSVSVCPSANSLTARLTSNCLQCLPSCKFLCLRQPPSFIHVLLIPPSSCFLFHSFIRCSTLPFPSFIHPAVSLYYSNL